MSKTQANPDNTPNCAENQSVYVAGVGARLLATLYDGMLILALLFLVSLLLVVVGTFAFGMQGNAQSDAQALPVWYQRAVLSPSFVLSLFGFYGLFWRKSGQTLGMQTWRLKTVTSDGKLLSWRQSFLRVLCATLAPALCALAGYAIYQSRGGALFSALLGFFCNYLFCLVHPKGLALHDLLSNTTTVRVPKIYHAPTVPALLQKLRKK